MIRKLHPLKIKLLNCLLFSYLYTEIYLWNFREAKPHSHPKNLHELVPGFGGLLACKVNCNGTKVSAAIKMVSTKVQMCFFCTNSKDRQDSLGSTHA